MHISQYKYIPRHAEETIKTLSQGFPIVAVTGPRQSGKSTLAARIFQDRPYVSLEDPDEDEFAATDPRGFLGQFPDGAVLDEIQRRPELLSYLQTIVDRDGRMNLFLLTGSQQFGLMAELSQTLAGRVGIVELLPFSLDELARADKIRILWKKCCLPDFTLLYMTVRFRPGYGIPIIYEPILSVMSGKC